ncbi:MAG: hypothetical protein V1720_03675 [bacterium]
MKLQKLFMFLLLGILVPFSISSNAQEKPKDQLYLVFEETAKVSYYEQYERTSKQWVELMTQAGLDISAVHASQRDDFHYYYLIPIEKYADLDLTYEAFKTAYGKIDKTKADVFQKENQESIETYRQFVIKWSAEFSYVPKESRLKDNEANFLHWLFFTYKLDKQKEVFDILREWKALYEKHNINHEYNIWTMEIGQDANLIALTESAKDGADYFGMMNETWTTLQAEEQVLWAKLSALMLETEQKFGYPRPDLSYIKK